MHWMAQMNTKKIIQWMSVSILITITLTSCGQGRLLGPTVPSSSTNTPKMKTIIPEPKIEKSEVPINGYNVYALGVADLDGDGRDDLYTVNHNGHLTLLRSTGNAEQPFEPLPTLPHDPQFPALADLAEPPVQPETGALVYWLRHTFHITAGHLMEPVVGTLTFQAEPIIESSGGAEVTITQLDSWLWAVSFRLVDGGYLSISHNPQNVAGWPVTLTLDSDPIEVSIGRPGDHPERESTFRLRDYHALVVRDLNGDGQPDIVALGGGLKGHAAELVPDAQETTFLSSTSGGYTAFPGPPKGGCATRSAEWEGDNTLRVTCGWGQADNVWVWVNAENSSGGIGMWQGGPAELSSVQSGQQRLGCESAILVKEIGLKLAKTALCAEGDFDGDGALELVVAILGENEIATATLYNPTH